MKQTLPKAELTEQIENEFCDSNDPLNRLTVGQLDKVKKFIATQRRELREKVEEKKQPDLDLKPGFNITAEYRLGQIRGRNEALDDFLTLLSPEGKE